MSDHSVLFAGLPSTGKTTYLALTNVAITTNADAAITIESYKGNFEYLNEISGVLESCLVAEHTEVDAQGELSLDLLIHGEPAHLHIPDISGETWEDALDTREWSRSFDEDVAGCDGLVLFVSANNVEMGGTILDAAALASALAGGGGSAPQGDAVPVTPSSEGSTPDEHSLLPADAVDESSATDESTPAPHKRARVRATQVDAVDLLQFVARRNRTRPIRLSIVLSAWDTVKKVTPAEWLDSTLPLLRQYLRNSRIWDTRVFGVSAQGGDFNDQLAKDELLPKSAVERASVCAGDNEAVSIFAPILWAVEAFFEPAE